MLLVHQTGSVKVGEVVRYTLTYTPSLDRILPIPAALHLRIKNTSAIPLRAAYLHGPYTLHVATYPSNFNPNQRSEDPQRDGVPEYEPHLKAGGGWTATLRIPDDVRTAHEFPKKASSPIKTSKSVTWIVEISSQIIFSSSAAVHFEVLVGRDEKSLDLGLARSIVGGQTPAGRVEDHQKGHGHQHGRHPAQTKGVYSKAIKLVVDDTTSLWSRPAFPEWRHRPKRDILHHTARSREHETTRSHCRSSTDGQQAQDDELDHKESQKRVHLVIVTHGLHSNIGADMLFLKESIDEAAREARIAARKRRASMRRVEAKSGVEPETGMSSIEPGDLDASQDASGLDSDDDDEQVIVRGYADNAVKTEKGIKYLGKRLAKYVLSMTYPQQPFLATKESTAKSITRSLTGHRNKSDDSGPASHANSSIHKTAGPEERLPYKVTSISFIGHSLGGLTQTYAVAYIQKHSPHFFEEIEPINFITLATPFLGLSNENPIYIKFALDFGLVGRTGKDLGLTWRAPTLARSGWGAVVGGLGSAASKTAHEQNVPGSKPLLRILPTGPAHKALKKFRNRTVYSNVVNDGIVPLRTSCLLFLDWSGLGRVEKARRENGLVGTMAGWGWAELTGQNSARREQSLLSEEVAPNEVVSRAEDDDAQEDIGKGAEVPQPSEDATKDDTVQGVVARGHVGADAPEGKQGRHSVEQSPTSPSTHTWDGLLSLFRPQRSQSPKRTESQSRRPNQIPPDKAVTAFKRGQTLQADSSDSALDEGISSDNTPGSESSDAWKKRPSAVRGESILEDPHSHITPPKTTIFESAGDLLNPPLPSTEFLINPSSRNRTIFHDRVYHPEDIPPMPPSRRRTGILRGSSTSDDTSLEDGNADGSLPPDSSSMKVEEKIARAYHRDMAWRKVLVRLEPDAHNNMFVRRMFANAYGWPVVKHLVDTHFGDTDAANTRDDEESGQERARSVERGVGSHGNELRHAGSRDRAHTRSPADVEEAGDEVGELHEPSLAHSTSSAGRPTPTRQDSGQWSDAAFDLTDDEDDEDKQVNPEDHRAAANRPAYLGKISILGGVTGAPQVASPKGTEEEEIKDFLGKTPPSVDKEKGKGRPIPGDLSQLGLRKSIDDNLGSPSKKKDETSDKGPNTDGVMEQVTRLSSSPGRQMH